MVPYISYRFSLRNIIISMDEDTRKLLNLKVQNIHIITKRKILK
jgi:hypothetical protein